MKIPQHMPACKSRPSCWSGRRAGAREEEGEREVCASAQIPRALILPFSLSPCLLFLSLAATCPAPRATLTNAGANQFRVFGFHPSRPQGRTSTLFTRELWRVAREYLAGVRAFRGRPWGSGGQGVAER